MIALAEAEPRVCFNSGSIKVNTTSAAQVCKRLAERATLIRLDALRHSAINCSPLIEVSYPHRVGFQVGQESGSAEVRTFIDDVQRRVTVDEQNIDGDALIESDVFGSDADSEVEGCFLVF